MATAEELLAGSSTVDKTLVVSNDLRKITIPSSVTNLGVEHDDEVLRLEFKIPRYVSDTDLSTFPVRINYINAQGESDVYTVRDTTVGAQYITFSWLVGPTATRYKGDTKFNVCMKKLASDGVTVDKEYNTTIATLPVLEGLEVDESIVTQYTDIIEQWRRDLFDEKDSLIADITEAAQAEQKAIEDKGAEVLATIPVDYQTAVSMTDNAERTKADAIICSSQGRNPIVTDSSDDHIRGLKLFGKTHQFVTTGKNLLPDNPDAYGVRNGVRFTRMSDGRIGVQGTATANTTFVFRSFEPGNRTPIPAGTYTLSGSPGQTVFLSMYIYESQEATDPLMYASSLCNGNVWTFTLENDAYYGAYLYVGKGKLASEYVSPQLELGSIATEYEIYSDKIASPSPGYQQNMTNATNDSAVDVWFTGANLLREIAIPAKTTSKGLTAEYEGDGVFHIYGTFDATGAIDGGIQLASTALDIPVDPDSSYIINARLLSGTPPGSFHPYLSASSDTVGDQNWLATAISPDAVIGKVYSTTYPARQSVKDATKIRRFWIYSYNSTLESYTTDFRIQIWFNKGRTSMEYEPYSEQQMSLSSTVNGLHGIKVESDGNYTDENGQQWVCDEVDFERGVFVQRIGTKILTGTEVYSDYVHDNVISFYLTHKSRSPALCTHGRYTVEFGWANDTYLLFRPSYFNITTLSEWITYVTDQYNNGTPITIRYILATPVETPLTVDEIETFKQLRTYFPITAVVNTHDIAMELKYNADTKTFLRNCGKPTEEQIQNAVNAWLDAHYLSAEGASF